MPIILPNLHTCMMMWKVKHQRIRVTKSIVLKIRPNVHIRRMPFPRQIKVLTTLWEIVDRDWNIQANILVFWKEDQKDRSLIDTFSVVEERFFQLVWRFHRRVPWGHTYTFVSSHQSVLNIEIIWDHNNSVRMARCGHFGAWGGCR